MQNIKKLLLSLILFYSCHIICMQPWTQHGAQGVLTEHAMHIKLKTPAENIIRNFCLTQEDPCLRIFIEKTDFLDKISALISCHGQIKSIIEQYLLDYSKDYTLSEYSQIKILLFILSNSTQFTHIYNWGYTTH